MRVEEEQYVVAAAKSLGKGGSRGCREKAVVDAVGVVDKQQVMAMAQWCIAALAWPRRRPVVEKSLRVGERCASQRRQIRAAIAESAASIAAALRLVLRKTQVNFQYEEQLDAEQ